MTKLQLVSPAQGQSELLTAISGPRNAIRWNLIAIQGITTALQIAAKI
jgi:hypothetical protein